ncbi:MAG: OstA-like protein [Crocinitomicaceae bacterium]
MKAKSYILNYALLIGAFFLSLHSWTQGLDTLNTDKVEFLGSGSVRIDGSRGAQILEDDVRFRYDTLLFRCDSLIIYSSKNTFFGYGNVHATNQKSFNLTSDSMHVYQDKKIAHVYGNVRLQDSSYIMTTDSLHYNTEEKYAYYLNNGTIVNIENNEIITSKRGYYYPDSRSFFFKGDVVIENPNYLVKSDTLNVLGEENTAYFFGPTKIFKEKSFVYCENGFYNSETEIAQFKENAIIIHEGTEIRADSIYFNMKDEIAKGFKNVIVIDTANKSIFHGDYLYTDQKKEYALMTEDPLVMQYDEKDTLFITADTIVTYKDSSQKAIINGFYHVAFLNSDFQGKCDSLYYSEKDSLLNMYKDPILWQEDNQITGDTIIIRTFDSKIDKMDIYSNAFIITYIDSVFYNQVFSKNMEAFFVESELDRVHAIGNGMTLYYPLEEEKTDSLRIRTIKGMNRIFCKDILLQMKEKDIDKITFYDKPDGKYYPMNQLKLDEMRLRGFKWRVAERPMSVHDIYEKANPEKFNIQVETVKLLTKEEKEQKKSSAKAAEDQLPLIISKP